MLNRRGFTITSLIVVMAVLSILVMLAVPKYLGQTKEAKMTRLLYDGRLLENACYQYYLFRL